MKHKVFFWLLLQDRLSTTDLLRRKQMELDSYTCDLCIRRKLETVAHLFLRCNFAKARWNAIGVTSVSTRPLLQIFKMITDKLLVPFAMDIIILMTWSIWTTRNNWMFENIDPQVQECKRKFLCEFSLVMFRTRQDMVNSMEVWMNTV